MTTGRRKILEVSQELIVDLIKRYADNLPADAVSVGVAFGGFNTVHFLIESSEFPNIPEGGVLDKMRPEERRSVESAT